MPPCVGTFVCPQKAIQTRPPHDPPPKCLSWHQGYSAWCTIPGCAHYWVIADNVQGGCIFLVFRFFGGTRAEKQTGFQQPNKRREEEREETAFRELGKLGRISEP